MGSSGQITSSDIINVIIFSIIPLLISRLFMKVFWTRYHVRLTFIPLIVLSSFSLFFLPCLGNALHKLEKINSVSILYRILVFAVALSYCIGIVMLLNVKESIDDSDRQIKKSRLLNLCVLNFLKMISYVFTAIPLYIIGVPQSSLWFIAIVVVLNILAGIIKEVYLMISLNKKNKQQSFNSVSPVLYLRPFKSDYSVFDPSVSSLLNYNAPQKLDRAAR
jgi:uncharacterized membrane protein